MTRISQYTAMTALAMTFALAAASLADTTGISHQISQASHIPYYPYLPLRAGGLVLADFNGDGKIDAALPGLYIAGALIVFNGGAETWINTGSWPTAIAAGDLDGDGDVDLAVAECNANTIGFLTNDGAGNFTRTGSYAVDAPGSAAGPSAIAAVDMDNDGQVELLVANRFTDVVKQLRRSNGAYHECSFAVASGEPNALAVADFDGNGTPDVAVACASEDTVTILLNINGQISGGGQVYPAGPYPVALAAADLDNDGDMDLVVADREAPQVTVLINNGQNQFESRVVQLLPAGYGAFDPPTDVQLVDVNYDGFVDIRCAGKTLLNDGTAHFSVKQSNAWTGAVYAQALLPSEPYTFQGVIYQEIGTNQLKVAAQIAGDIDGDGHVDVIDLLTLADSWGLSEGQTGFDPAADINMDASVDRADLLLMASNWGV